MRRKKPGEAQVQGTRHENRVVEPRSGHEGRDEADNAERQQTKIKRFAETFVTSDLSERAGSFRNINAKLADTGVT
jgi:hypothetical protein